MATHPRSPPTSTQQQNKRQVANLELVVMVVLGCVLWNLLAFFTFAKRMFPNFWCADATRVCLRVRGHRPSTTHLPQIDQLNPPFPPQTNTNLSGQINSTHTPFPPTQTKTTRYARGVTLMGDALGHSWVGLLLARAIDPQLQTPVPLAFTYKLLVGVFVCVVCFRFSSFGGWWGCGGVVVGCRVIGTHRHPPNHLPDTPNKTPIRTRSSSSRAPGAKTEL